MACILELPHATESEEEEEQTNSCALSVLFGWQILVVVALWCDNIQLLKKYKIEETKKTQYSFLFIEWEPNIMIIIFNL